MSVVGSYVLGLQNRQAGKDVDLQTVAARFLKLIAERPFSLGELLSLTGYGESAARAAIETLRKQELVEGGDEKLTLTPLGYRAHFVVAS